MTVLVAQSCPTLCDPVGCSCQAPLSLEFFRQEYWSGLAFSSPGDRTQDSCTSGNSLPSEPSWAQGISTRKQESWQPSLRLPITEH